MGNERYGRGRAKRIVTSVFVHLSLFLAGLVLAYRVVYEDHQDDDIKEQYGIALDKIGDTLASRGVDLSGLKSQLEEAEAIYADAPNSTTGYNDELTVIVVVLILAFLVIALVVCRDWRMFGIVVLENIYILLLLGLTLVACYAGLRHYIMVPWTDMANHIVSSQGKRFSGASGSSSK